MDVNNNLSTEKVEKTANQNFKVRAGDLPVNHREIDKLQANDLAKQLAYKKAFQQFFIFRRHGDEVIGRLCQAQGYTGFAQKPYPIELQNGATILIPGNRHLQRIFKKFDLVGKWIRIVYMGDKWLRSRHKMKIYQVFDYTEKIKRGPASPAIQKILADTAKKQSA